MVVNAVAVDSFLLQSNPRRFSHGVTCKFRLSKLIRRNSSEIVACGAFSTQVVPVLEFCSALERLAFVPPPACFDAQCQAAKDSLYLSSIVLPLGLFVAFIVFKVIEQDRQRVSVEDSFKDVIARDSRGEIAYRAVGYTPLLTEQDDDDEVIRVPIGSVGSVAPVSFVFKKILQHQSRLIVIRLPRPLGIVFEEDKKSKRVFIAEIVEGSAAAQLQKRSALDPSLSMNDVQEGDLLRAFTTTTIVYKTGALMFGAQKPEREILLFGADGESWPKVSNALSRGLKSDGEVTLVLERRISQV
jgi:hypothetical protein